MEPKDDYPIENNLDLLLVPTVGISQDGIRIGYGHEFMINSCQKIKLKQYLWF